MRLHYILFLFLPYLFLSCNEDQQILPEEVTISGTVVTNGPGVSGDEEGLLAGVTVKLLQDGEQIREVEDATFRFENIEAGRNYTIVPEKMDDALVGVSSVDISLLQQYIDDEIQLDIQQLVAADMDRSLFVNQNDLDILEECTQTPMMMYCLDWRFVHENCTSLDQEAMINTIQFNNLTGDRTEMKIYGMRSGNLKE